MLDSNILFIFIAIKNTRGTRENITQIYMNYMKINIPLKIYLYV